jgi:PTH1 family peptidyl-tRNA hydrolase
MIRLAAFLGNPGTQYSSTRHNLGRMVLTALPEAATLSWREKFHGSTATLPLSGRQLTLLVPEVYMNQSGKSVGEACRFFKIAPEELLVVHDELELPFGTVDVRRGGGYGGNNGLKSVGSALGSSEFYRVRAGIGRPERGSVSAHVLSKFSPEEEAQLEQYCRELASVVKSVLAGAPDRLAREVTKQRLLTF